MSPLVKRLGFSCASALGIEWLKKKSPIPIISPYHHLVSDEPVPYIAPLYGFKNSRQFEADLDWLLAHFQPLSLQDVIESMEQAPPTDRNAPSGRSHPTNRNNPSEKKGFLLCFDDGLRQVYETAAPILLRKGVPAALFLNSAFIDNKEIFYSLQKGWLLHKLDDRTSNRTLPDPKMLAVAGERFGQRMETIAQLRAAIRSIQYANRHLADELQPLLGIDADEFQKTQRPHMTGAEIKELIAKGFAIGSHSIDHPLYSQISPEEQRRQTLQSTQSITTNFDLPYKAFAFPHVDTGVGNDFFTTLGGSLDLILGNRTGMLEHHPRVLHRFIGENPAIPIDRMVKAVLAYSVIRHRIGSSYVKRK